MGRGQKEVSGAHSGLRASRGTPAAQGSPGRGTQSWLPQPGTALHSTSLFLLLLCPLTPGAFISWLSHFPPLPLTFCSVSVPFSLLRKVPGLQGCGPADGVAECGEPGKALSLSWFLCVFYWEQVELENEEKPSASVDCKQFPALDCDILSLITSPS